MKSSLWFGPDDSQFWTPLYNSVDEFLNLKSKFVYNFSLKIPIASFNLKNLKKLLDKPGIELKAVRFLGGSHYVDINSTAIDRVFGKNDDCWFNGKLSDDNYYFNIFGNYEDKVGSFAKQLLEFFTPFVSKDDSESPLVNIDFYQMTSNGPMDTRQKLLCPTWGEIEKNYSQPILKSIEKLVNDKTPWSNGKLLIINGPPGCGKTYFIRSLLRAWRNLLKPTVILDPEEFSRNPLYYFQISSDESYEKELGGNYKTINRPRLLIMEDCADLIMTESRSAHYDKVGKLLNMTDGLLGQGRNDVFLISFNEEIKEIDPAFRRPGRLLMSLEIPKLSQTESLDWLVGRGHKPPIEPREYTLAELYEMVSNVDSKIVSKANVGFSKQQRVGF